MSKIKAFRSEIVKREGKEGKGEGKRGKMGRSGGKRKSAEKWIARFSSAKIKEENLPVVRKSVLIKAVSSEIPLSRSALTPSPPLVYPSVPAFK